MGATCSCNDFNDRSEFRPIPFSGTLVQEANCDRISGYIDIKLPNEARLYKPCLFQPNCSIGHEIQFNETQAPKTSY